MVLFEQWLTFLKSSGKNHYRGKLNNPSVFTKIRPVNFSTEHRNMLSNLHTVISKGYLAFKEIHDKLVSSLRTTYAEELNLKKDQTSYSDLLDAIRLALNGYNIK